MKIDPSLTSSALTITFVDNLKYINPRLMNVLSSRIEPNQTDTNRTESSRIEPNQTIKQKPLTFPVIAKWHFFVLFLLGYALSTSQMNAQVNVQMNTQSAFESGATLEYLLIGNEGGFGSSNATISRYNPVTKNLLDGVFLGANGIGLGDVLQSLQYYDGQIYAVMNNSAQIVVMDPKSFTQQGLISLPDGASPRQILHLNAEIAYVTDLYGDLIHLINPATQQVLSTKISVGDGPEFMVYHQEAVFVGNYGFGQDSTIMVIDPAQHKVVDTLVVASGPGQITMDNNGDLWVVCTGYAGDYDEQWNLIEGTQRPGGLFRIEKDAQDQQWRVTKELELKQAGIHLGYDPNNEYLYLQSEGIKRVDLTQSVLAPEAIISGSYYSFYYESVGGDIYLADAKDYVSAGSVRVIDTETLQDLDTFSVGIIPGSFLAIYASESTAIDQLDDEGPSLVELYPNYPNPFNPTTQIQYSIPESGFVELVIFNSLGQKVAILEQGIKQRGRYTQTFNAQHLPSGVYYAHVLFNGYQRVTKMLLIK